MKNTVQISTIFLTIGVYWSYYSYCFIPLLIFLFMEQILEQYVDRLIEEKGLPVMDAEELAQINSDLSDRLEDRFNASILEHMPSHKLEEFEKILDTGSAEEIQQ